MCVVCLSVYLVFQVCDQPTVINYVHVLRTTIGGEIVFPTEVNQKIFYWTSDQRKGRKHWTILRPSNYN